jgi:hypothetical protein
LPCASVHEERRPNLSLGSADRSLIRESKIRFLRCVCLAVSALGAAGALPADDLPSTDQCSPRPAFVTPDSIGQSTDEQTGITWYMDKATTGRLSDDAFYLYAGRKGCDVWLRLRIQYVSEKPLVITRAQVKADDKTFEVAEPRFKRDSNGKLTWQWYDEPVTPDHLLMLFTVTASKNATVRFIGSNRVEERTLSDAEKAALKTVLGAYHTLGGKL